MADNRMSHGTKKLIVKNPFYSSSSSEDMPVIKKPFFSSSSSEDIPIVKKTVVKKPIAKKKFLSSSSEDIPIVKKSGAKKPVVKKRFYSSSSEDVPVAKKSGAKKRFYSSSSEDVPVVKKPIVKKTVVKKKFLSSSSEDIPIVKKTVVKKKFYSSSSSSSSEDMLISKKPVAEKPLINKFAVYTPEECALFVFYSKSADAYPGKGAGEQLCQHDVKKYAALNTIKDWRKMLSNFYIHHIKIDGLTWASVEHYYQASKFKKGNRSFYKQFSIESGTELSKDPVIAKGAGGKSGKSKGKQIRPTSIKADADFFEGRGAEEMHLAQDVKFSDKALSRMLCLTHNAVLMHNMGRGKYIRFTYVEGIRDRVC